MSIRSLLNLFLASCLIFSCSKPEKTENQNTADTLVKANEIKMDTVKQAGQSPEEKAIDYKSFNAIMTGSDPSLRKDSSMKGDALTTLRPGQQVNILEKGKVRMSYDPQKEDPCTAYGYYWYKVSTGKETGWVWGNELLQKGKSFIESTDGLSLNLKSLLGKEISVRGKKLFFDVAIDLNIGASNEEGLTGCDRHFYPYFYDETGKIYFIKADQRYFVGKDFLVQSSGSGNLMMILDSDGGAVDLKRIGTTKRFDQEVIVIYCDHSYQDGGAGSVIYIAWKDEQLKVVDYVLNKQ